MGKTPDGPITGNRGEWSEIYAFLRLLCDGELHGANADLSPDENQCLDVIRVARRHGASVFRGEILPDGSVALWYNGARTVSRKELKSIVMLLLAKIKESPKGSGSFAEPGTEAFLRSIGCVAIKASSRDKKDLDVTVLDNHVGGEQTYGLSIKSELGASPTLLNATGATQFEYEVTGLDEAQARAIMAITPETVGKRKWFLERAVALRESGARIRLVAVKKPAFRRNLLLLDDALPEILGEMLLVYTLNRKTSVAEACAHVAAQDPRGYGDPSLYTFKVRRFLRAVALGMEPGTPWQDSDEATGGYLIVTKEGELVAFYVYNRAKLDDYLFHATRFETPSTKRTDILNLRRVGDAWRFFLTLQIRFR